MNKLLICYLGSIIIGISLHSYVGFYIKKRFKINSLLEEFKLYHKDYKKNNRDFKSFARYLSYLIPIFNIILGIVEYSIKDEVYSKLVTKVKIFDAKSKVKDVEYTLDLPTMVE